MKIDRKNVYLYHIGYSEETSQLIEDGYILLDNRSNERPDWYESWPIRQYLKNNVLEEQAYYGFFSPKFRIKTGLQHDQIVEEICNNEIDIDAFIICPQSEVGAFFLNPFHGSEFTDKGALKTSQKIFDLAEIPVNLESLIIDSEYLSFSNYIVAKPSFWDRWLKVVDVVYAAADNQIYGELFSRDLCHVTQYNDNAQRKVFFIENIASVLFLIEKMHVKNIPIMENLAAKGVMSDFKEQALICDALKIAARSTKRLCFLELFKKETLKVLDKFTPKPIGRLMQEMKKIVVVVASRYSEEDFYTKSATGKSLRFFNFPQIEVCLYADNKAGLSFLYNQAIERYLKQDCILVFAHDDLHFIDFFWPQHLYQGLESYDIVGIVGNRSRAAFQPNWAFKDINGTWDSSENLSGSISHGYSFPPHQFTVFGPNGPVRVLDGLLIAASTELFNSYELRFDEIFKFHFYDMDFCRSAETLKLDIGTIPLSLIHESTGNFANEAWLESYKEYLLKWSS
jgi:hypothetical protein